MDHKIKAKYRPRKRFKKGLGGSGDWARKFRKMKPKRRASRKRGFGIEAYPKPTKRFFSQLQL